MVFGCWQNHEASRCEGYVRGGNRPSLILCDDIESLDGVLSPEQRQKTRDWFFKDVLKAGQVDGSTNVLVIGTCLHPESLLSELLVSPSFTSVKYQSVISPASNTALWEAWSGIYTQLSNPERFAEAAAFFQANREAMLAGSEVLWPAVEPYDTLMTVKLEGGIASFNSEKQNDPYDPERQLFNMAHARRCQPVFNDGQLHGMVHLDSGRTVYCSEWQIVAFHDPALGKKAGQATEPDDAAIVVVAKDQYGYLYCVDAYIGKEPITKQIDQAFELARRWGIQVLYLEDNCFQGLLKTHYADAQHKYPDNYLLVKGVTQTENKYQRISTLEPDITNGYLLFADNVNPRLMEQLTQFPTGRDDGPDALEGAVRKLRKRYDEARLQPPWAEG